MGSPTVQLASNGVLRLLCRPLTSRIVVIDSLPRGATGKIDRRSLPEPSDVVPRRESGSVRPEGEVEEILASIWADALGIEAVGVTEDFFALGGDSILSIRIIARAHKAGLQIGPREFFENPTTRELADLIEAGAELNI